MISILLIEDEEKIRKFLRINLRGSEFDTDEAATKAEALLKLKEKQYDVVLLDLGLPDGNGLEISEYIRKEASSTGIIMLTAMGSDMDKLLGFEYGADDYIVKPFNPLEVVARINALIKRTRRVTLELDKQILKFTGLQINMATRTVTKGDSDIHLTPREYELLILLATHTNTIFSREEILSKVWGSDFFGEGSTVDVHIRRLREKIEDHPKSPILIKTVWGIGYQWGGQDEKS